MSCRLSNSTKKEDGREEGGKRGVEGPSRSGRRRGEFLGGVSSVWVLGKEIICQGREGDWGGGEGEPAPA